MAESVTRHLLEPRRQFMPSRAISLGVIALLVVAASGATHPGARSVPCDPGNASLTLPPGFCATVFADKVGAPRHMVVAPNGDVLVIGNSFATNAEAGGSRTGGSLMLLRDANGDGKAELVKRLKPGNGSGIALANGYLYTSAGPSIVRYKYATGDTVLGAADTFVSGFATGGHTAYNFQVIGGTIYMNVGSRTNACQPAEVD